MATAGLALPLMFYDGVYHVAATRVGQNGISLLDRLMCIVEGLNFYAAPESQQQESRQQSKEMYYYQRPLPWFLFIPMLFFFRILRNVLSVAFWMLGMEPISPMTVVYYMQGLRRKLRYIKIEGSRMMNDANRGPSQLPLLARIAINLFTWGPLQFVTIIARLVMGDKQYNTYTSAGPKRSQKRSLKKLKGADNEECTTDELLDKFAEEDDNDPANDSDFKVKPTDLETETEEEDDDLENSEPEEDAGVRENGANHPINNLDGGDHNQDQQRNDETNGQPADNQNNQEHNQNHNEEHNNHC